MAKSGKGGDAAGKLKPQPYESFEEAERRREEEAAAVNPPLSEAQKEAVEKQSGTNPVEQTVADVLKEITKEQGKK